MGIFNTRGLESPVWFSYDRELFLGEEEVKYDSETVKI